MPETARYPKVITHIGLSVSDLERAIDWYSSVLGFTLIAPTRRLDGATHAGRVAATIYGDRFGACLQAQMSAGNGIGLELFQFLEPETPENGPGFEYWLPGFFHICVVDPDIEGLVDRIAGTGGVARTAVLTLCEGKPYRLAYCEDPFGNVVEVFSHSHEQTFSNR